MGDRVTEEGRRARRVTGASAAGGAALGGRGSRSGGGEAKKRKKAKQRRPNIVLIMDDDQSVNLQQFLTKTNAAIAGKGVTFDNSFVNYSLCCPSRSTMLTGQYAHNHGVRGNKPPTGGYSKLAPTLGNTLPVWLQRAGYYTAHIGKFLNGYGTTSPGHRGPARMERVVRVPRQPGCASPAAPTRRTATRSTRTARSSTTAPRPDVVDPATYQTDVYSQKAADFIRRRAPSRQPFYLSVAPRDPHGEAASCNCAGDNPRAAPRYEGTLAGLTARETQLQRGRRLGQALEHQEPGAAHPGADRKSSMPPIERGPSRCWASTTWSRTSSARCRRRVSSRTPS